MDTEKEAEQLVIATCKRDLNGNMVAPLLAEEQTLDNLYKFGDQLRGVYFSRIKGRFP